MSPNQPRQLLPLDVILTIIECLVSTLIPSPVALPPEHLITRTLLSLTLTSRAISPTARRILFTHCLYIQNPRRLARCLEVLSDPIDPLQPCPSSRHLLSSITSLYLQPLVSEDHSYDSHMHIEVRRLLSIVGPHLRRLLIDMPLRTLYREEDDNEARRILRSGFIDLPVLEEFCSARDELYLGTSTPLIEPPVWSLWPKLRTLALYNEDIDRDNFWAGLRKLEHIQTVVLTRADGLEDTSMKQRWRDQFDTEEMVRPLEFVVVNVEAQHRISLGIRESEKMDKLRVRKLNVPTSFYGDEDPIWLCQEWVKRRIMQGQPIAGWD